MRTSLSRWSAPALALALAACGGGDGGAGGDPGGSGGPVPCAAGPSVAGRATFYDASSATGRCSWDPRPAISAAVSPAVFAGSGACGTCVEIAGPAGAATAVVTDECPSCADADLDLSAEAFALVAEPAAGRVDVSWRTVPCPVTGPLRYRFGEGVNPWWVALVPMDHRHAVAALEVRGAGDADYRPMTRNGVNAFVWTGTPELAGPVALRATDVHGHVLVDEGVPFAPPIAAEAALVSGAGNFSETCP